MLVRLRESDTEETEIALPATEIHRIQIPQTYTEAIADPKFSSQQEVAITEELTTLVKNSIQEEVILSRNANLVTYKQVFTIKTRADGGIDRFKVRLVIRGFT